MQQRNNNSLRNLNMKYYYEPNDKWYDTKQELVDAYN